MSEYRLNFNRMRVIGSLSFILVVYSHFFAIGIVVAQAQENIEWSAPENLSDSPDKTSTDPFLLADPAGFVHMFWGEKVTDTPGEQADTLMYTRWNGKEWTKPIDIFFAPPQEINLIIAFPQAIIDEQGRIHLVWLGEPNAPSYSLYYSSVDATQAVSAQAWLPRATLAEGLTGTKYSMDIAFSSPNTIHIIYARVPAGDNIREERAVTYIRSTDGGDTWSDPTDIYTIPYLTWGASDTRLLADPSGNLYASWTLWDETGNGQAVYFARSLDNGLTWDIPISLAERIDPEYERDWNGLALLGPNQIVSIWEGGYRAYRYVMYSYDGGQTWTEPVDVFPYLIGDNGRVQFVRDSLDRLHVFVAQRIREGNEVRGQRLGLWHSIWLGDTLWTDPLLVTKDAEAARNMTNPAVTIVNGNQIVAAWYGSGINEIMVQTGVITDAPYVAPVPWKQNRLPPSLTPTPTGPSSQSEAAKTPNALSDNFDSSSGSYTANGLIIMIGVLPALVVVLSLFSVQYTRLRNK